MAGRLNPLPDLVEHEIAEALAAVAQLLEWARVDEIGEQDRIAGLDPIVRRVGRVLVISPGSAGDARDHRNGYQLSCAVLDTASEEVQLIDFPDPR